MSDRSRWNARYRQSDHVRREPRAELVELDSYLPRAGKALDVAGGTGHNAAWLAERGLEVTLVDVSDEAVARARAHGVEAIQLDLESEPPPAGPWDLVLMTHYLQRDLISALASQLTSDGVLVLIHPTVTNLERNERPSRRWLLDVGEAERLLRDAGLDVEHAAEGWTQGQHLARVVGRSNAR